MLVLPGDSSEGEGGHAPHATTVASLSCLVFGAGAVGCYLGGRLAGVGPARLLARPAIAEAIGENGLVLRLADRELTVRPEVTTRVGDPGPADTVFLTVRADDVAAAVPDLNRVLAPGGFVLAFQNGVGSEEELADGVGRERVIVATLTARVSMTEPGIVTQDSRSGGIALATLTGAPVPGGIIELFRGAGLAVMTVPDYRSLRWSKLLLNVLGAGTTAILDQDIAVVLADPRLFRIDQLVVREAGRVMEAAGIRTVSLPSYPVSLVRGVMRLPRPAAQRLLGPRIAGARGGKSPTARSDLQRGRSELPWFYGPIGRLGREHGIATPVSDAMGELVSALIVDPDQRAGYRGQSKRLVAYLGGRGIRL